MTPEAMAREVRGALCPPFEPGEVSLALAALVRTLGITEEMVRIVHTEYEGERRKAATALRALLIAAKGEEATRRRRATNATRTVGIWPGGSRPPAT